MTVLWSLISPVPCRLHWLPIEIITFKILLTFKGLNGLAPSYLSELISSRSETRTFRLTSESSLSVATSNHAFGDRAFSVCVPQLWNTLPQVIKASDNVDSFKKRLKTNLFIEAFGMILLVVYRGVWLILLVCYNVKRSEQLLKLYLAQYKIHWSGYRPRTFTRMFERRHNILSNVRTNVRNTLRRGSNIRVKVIGGTRITLSGA